MKRGRRRRRSCTPHRRTKWWDAFTAAWSVIGTTMRDREITALRRFRPWCATCLAYGPALRPRCLDGKLFLFCERCDESDVTIALSHPPRRRGAPRALRWQRVGYQPLDETERDLSFRILRTVSRFDWVMSGDVADLIGVPSTTADAVARNAFSVRISYLTRHGFLRRRHVSEFPEYQITNLGRSRIENLTRAAVEAKASIAA